MTSKVVLITGASRGFGEAAAQEMARRGHTIVATMRSPERDGENVRRGYEDHIHPMALDVTDSAAVHSVVAEAHKRFGRIDAAINNAGYGLYGPVEDLSEAELQRQMNTNFVGQWRVCKAVIPVMREQGGGTIVNVSSTAGKLVGPLMGLYSASKFAVEAMSEALRYEVSRFGIHVVILEPGMYRSDWQTTSLDVCEAVRDGKSHYQESTDAALKAFRELAITRPGSQAVAVAMADIVDLVQTPPMRWPVGEDAARMLPLRKDTPDDQWEQMIRRGAFFNEGQAGDRYRAFFAAEKS
jgi:NAD(P)-dependent dehydrogenase (short-subunit alcohol dehydrogenase family)